jgi:hypothetical protein
MAEIVNLNKHRKVKAREDRESTAGANRIKYGRTKAQKANDQREADRRTRLHEEGKLESEKDT